MNALQALENALAQSNSAVSSAGRPLVERLRHRESWLREALERTAPRSGELRASEARDFERLAEEVHGEIDALQARIAQVQDGEARAARAQTVLCPDGETRSYSPARVMREPATYQGRHDGPSFFRDIATLSARGYDPDVAERMSRHSREVADSGRQERALNTTDGTGGEMVPPLWMVDQFVAVARAARVTADLLTQDQLPPGTDSLNLPKIATGTTVAEQTTQNTSVSNTDATTTSVNAAVATYAGQQVVALQFLEQSPINTDEVILRDLAADYAAKLDVAILTNNVAGKRGLLNVSGINAVTYTDATPTVSELYPKIADGIQQITTGRFLGPECIVMHPRRWAWFCAAVDSSGRPFVLPSSQGPNNATGLTNTTAAEGYAGQLLGMPVYIDPNIPTNLGAGTNEDRIIVGRFSDSILYEGNPRAEAFRETKADQLSVLLRFYNYAAWTAERYPKSLSVISGTGLVPPVF